MLFRSHGVEEDTRVKEVETGLRRLGSSGEPKRFRGLRKSEVNILV